MKIKFSEVAKDGNFVYTENMYVFQSEYPLLEWLSEYPTEGIAAQKGLSYCQIPTICLYARLHTNICINVNNEDIIDVCNFLSAISEMIDWDKVNLILENNEGQYMINCFQYSYRNKENNQFIVVANDSEYEFKLSQGFLSQNEI